jgi:hypothetical protein
MVAVAQIHQNESTRPSLIAAAIAGTAPDISLEG